MNLLPDTLQSNQFAGVKPETTTSRTVLLKIGGYDLSSDWESEIPNVVDDSFLQRKGGIFGFPLLEQPSHLGFGDT